MNQFAGAVTLGIAVWVVGLGSTLVSGQQLPAGARSTAPTPIEGHDGANRLDRFYTETQAARGEVAYNRSCVLCHSMDPKLSTKAEWESLGFSASFGGEYIQRRMDPHTRKLLYPTLFEVYVRLQTMPVLDTQAITPQTRADILAYMLRENGFPPGPDELLPDPGAMKTMMTNEPRFERIFNRKDLSGLRTNVEAALKVVDGLLYCHCNVHGTFWTEKRYENFTLRFDYRHVPPDGWTSDHDQELFQGQGGFIVDLVEPNGVAGRSAMIFDGRHYDMVQPQGGARQAKHTVDVEARRRARRPVGEWNSIEIVLKGGHATASINGVLISTVDGLERLSNGSIGFQIQGSPMYYRNIRVRRD